MKNLSSIRVYPSNIELIDTEGNFYAISTDGLIGVLSREEWEEDETIRLFDDDSRLSILDKMKSHDIF